MRTTIVDIKNRTGLSLATISKYLNGGNVRPENREKIEEAIEALHYQVNESARSLVTNRTRLIGVIVFSIENLFVATMVHHIGENLKKHGYSMLISDSNNNKEQELFNVRSMIQKNVDGILILPYSDDPSVLEPAKNTQTPIVCVDRHFSDYENDSVILDNRGAAEKLTEILIREHHKKIALIGSNLEYTGRERLQGFLDAMKKASLPVDEKYLILNEHSMSAGYEGMKQLLAFSERPTAIVSSNYEITLGAVMAIHESIYHYPEDFSLVGFDNLMLSDVVQPRITVAIQPLEQMAVEASAMILQRIDEQKNKELSLPCEHRILHARIVEYESVLPWKE